MEATGKVRFLTDTVDVSKKDTPFFTRTVCISTEDELNGTIIEGNLPIQAQGDKCKMLDDLNVGDTVKIIYGIRGNVSVKENLAPTPKNPRSEQGFVSLSYTRHEVVAKAGSAPATTTAASTTVAQPIADDLPF